MNGDMGSEVGGHSESRASLRDLIMADLEANRRNVKGMVVMTLFRLTHSIRQEERVPRPISLLIVAAYRFVTEGVLGIELRSGATVGPGLRIDHGVGLVVHDHAVIGRNVLLRHNVTIGVAQVGGPCPVIGDEVEFGTGAVAVGGISIGDRVHVGANAVVICDIPADGRARAAATVVSGRSNQPR